MAKENSLIFTKERSGVTYDTEANGVYVLEGMPIASFEAKTFEQDWPDENGVDVYDANVVYVKAADITIPMISVTENGKTWLENYNALLSYLTTGGTLHTMTNSYTGETLSGVRFVKSDPEAPTIVGASKPFVKFKLVLRVTKPNA